MMHTAAARPQLAGAQAVPVSVVIPAYNAAAYLPAALQSIFEQSARPAEIIVVDDGSTDATADVARSFGVRVISVPNCGPSAARNVGTRAATGEFIAYMDADDLWAPTKLAVQTAALLAYAEPAFSFTDYRTFDEHGIHERHSGLRRHPAFRRIVATAARIDAHNDVIIAPDGTLPVLYDSYIQPSSALVRRSDVLSIGGFDELLRVHEDHEFFLRLFNLRPAICIMQSLLLYRRHPAQATANPASMRTGVFELACRVAAAPERYPRGDARYFAETGFLRYYNLGIQQARGAHFDQAAQSFKRSLAARRTLRAGVALAAANACRGAAGRRVFNVVRAMVKRRFGLLRR